MIDQVVLQGAGVGLAGIVTGIGLIVFTENQGERSNARGSLSEGMSTRMAGGLIEDTDKTSFGDLGGLTSQLENALKESNSEFTEELELTEAEMAKIAEDLSDGW